MVITIDDYTISMIEGDPAEWPIPWQGSGAKLKERLEIAGDRGWWCGLRVDRRDEPCLKLAIKYPADVWSEPRVLLVPETAVLFLKVSGRIYLYDLRAGLQLAYERMDLPSWRWLRDGDTVLLVAELDLMAWDISGRHLWSTYIEPPHDVTVRDGVVYADAYRLAKKTKPGRWRFPLREGPAKMVVDRTPSPK